MSGSVSPLAPAAIADLPPIAGVRLAVADTGETYAARTDLMLALFDAPASVAGVFTTSQTASAPVELCREHLKGGMARAIIVNAGNANAFTGKRGESATAEVVRMLAEHIGCDERQVFAASTGVIGQPLDAAAITRHLTDLTARAGDAGFLDAARAIMTTDTFPKLAAATARLNGEVVRINGIAKGSGMIAPDMATMLGFLFTDAALPPEVLQPLLEEAVADTFNCITVDGDTSTSDTVLLCATGRGTAATDAADPALADFRAALHDVCLNLAHQIVRDGEGARKFVTITVSGAAHDAAAKRIAMSIANSPLVKTAIAGEDANWGRIVMAVGKAGEQADRDRLCIDIGGVRVATNGEADPDYREERVQPHMQGREIDIAVDVGVGTGRATVYTCDLTCRYIEINADYRS